MKKGNARAYYVSVVNGWIDEFLDDKKEQDGFWDVFENVLEASRYSKGARDMIKNFGGAYNSARRKGWLKLLEYGKNCEEN